MRFIWVLLTITVFVACGLSCDDESWSEYKKTFAKSYQSAEEDQHRHEIFCDNLKNIEEHNKRVALGEFTYRLGINQFTDLNQKEFRRYVGLGA